MAADSVYESGSVRHGAPRGRDLRRAWLRHSGWLIPLLYAAAALALGLTLPRIEHHWFPHLASGLSIAAAMSICSAVASGMLALTSVVFSLVFVMITFSATAYSPRLVMWMARDPVMAHAMGIFSATFLYALMVLSWVDRETTGRVPLISSELVFVLLLASLGVFIALIDRIGALRIGRILVFTGDRGRRAIAALYDAGPAPAREGWRPRPGGAVRALCHEGRPQVIQAVRVAALVRLARVSGAVIELSVGVGEAVIEPAPLLLVHGGAGAPAERALRDAVELGDERTFEQDPKYALRILVDIAIRALSPAINDPTTAVQALHQVEDLLLRLGRSRLEIGTFRDETGAPRLIAPFPTWDDLLRLGLDEIRAYGAGSVQVMRRMSALLANLASLLPPERLPAVRHWELRLADTVRRTFADAEEQAEALVADREGLGLDVPEARP